MKQLLHLVTQIASLKQLFIIFCLSGCATRIPYSYEEQCALQNLKFVGANTETGSLSTYNYKTGLTSGSTSATTVQCTVPTNEIEKCEVDDLRISLEPTVQYNENITTKEWVTGVGYILYVVPGVVAKIVYDNKYDAAIADARSIRQTQSTCKSKHPHGLGGISSKGVGVVLQGIDR